MPSDSLVNLISSLWQIFFNLTLGGLGFQLWFSILSYALTIKAIFVSFQGSSSFLLQKTSFSALVNFALPLHE